MKKNKLTLGLGAFSKGEVLTRTDLKKVTGGNMPVGSGCYDTYFMVKAEGRGYESCYAIDTSPPLPPPGAHNCKCYFTLVAQHPCGFA